MTLKKIIPCIAALIAAVIAAVICIIAFRPNGASADMPEPPAEIPSGNYYIDGNPNNDDLYIVVDGGNIRFANKDNNLREAFKNVNFKIDPTLSDKPTAIEEQLNQDMADWGADNYTYKTKRFVDREDFFMVMFAITEDEDDDRIWSGHGFKFFHKTNTLSGWAGDFVLVE